MPELVGKTILITGAAGGFGREMLRQFLQAGSFLVLSDRELVTLHEAVSLVARGVGPVRGRVLGFVAADLASEAGCVELHRQATAITPQIDMLVNNAGLAGSGSFVDMPRDVWERLLRVNLLAPIRLSALFLPAMIARRSGQIVNIASVAGLVGTSGLAAYSTSKFGLRGFGEALADELAPYGVGVTTIYPFFARTPILAAPHYGDSAPLALPDWMIGDPALVIAALLAGIRAGKREIVPGAIAQQIAFANRYAPGALALFWRLANAGGNHDT
jgi:NAD(P)-dependent dehydrogenase (short-subunit alcohol dehydrogenase family)